MSRTLIGIVSSTKPDKTIVVTVHTPKTHPVYKKQYSISKKIMAHDPANEARVGDKVAITETRPLSARKRHVLSKVLVRPLISEEESVDVVASAPEEVIEKVITPNEASK